ncbi:MAG: DUF1844 domain-containing protein [Planctomycetota bacterium]|nr:MAG: DUF1844 domain-containing protein [Planctomycetota bacterium]
MNQNQNLPPGGDFRLFVQKISMQGFFALGLVELPGQEKPQPNLAMCQAVIQDLELLKEKTSGNLTEGEAMTLDKFLGDLNNHYQRVAQAQAE